MNSAGGKLTGVEATAILREMEQQNADLGRTVIVGVSGNELKGDFLSKGADLFWTKPIPSDTTIKRELEARLARYHAHNK